MKCNTTQEIMNVMNVNNKIDKELNCQRQKGRKIVLHENKIMTKKKKKDE